MSKGQSSPKSQDLTWLVFVPRRFEFDEPLFHFGERVKFCQESKSEQTWETGRIFGMHFHTVDKWIYAIQLDGESSLTKYGVQQVNARQSELRLVSDSCSVRNQVSVDQIWFFTTEAASRLEISEIQLRRLRLNGRFKDGYHYRDISLPGSELPRYQWNVERCAKALEASRKR